MGRQKRTWSGHHFYHVVCRGNRRDALFKDATDFMTFLYIINEVYDKWGPFEMASYCLMTNHYHFQIRSQEEPLSKIMSMINKKYANYYNTRYRLTGHVYEKRYYDKVIETKTGMLEVSRYIHLNPAEAHMVKRPEDYPWSSYVFYKGLPIEKKPYLNTQILLDYFSGYDENQRKEYCDFVTGRNEHLINQFKE